jgi:formate hydrogenlyase subunit 3/multisubunit Na+/H+ antiporter MnhD subunit
VVAGNYETLFAGWEVLGVSSFLLIAFYRDRYLPVKNALKVFSVYRIADVGLLLAMWMSHHFWHANVPFSLLDSHELVREHLAGHQEMAWVIAAALLLTAMAKSAQLPFTAWLPRAMEGPTPSSAIFYGSLSVHMGAFILLRTHAFWSELPLMPWLIGAVGLVTALVATGIARVQSSVKAQIAYASAAQIGIIFIEIALGWNTLALVHISGNALLRTYQLLISPSVVTYQIREQLFGFNPSHRSREHLLPARLRDTLYVLSIKEFNLDTLMYRWLWNPIKSAGRRLDFLTVTGAMALFGPVIMLLVVLLLRPEWVPAAVKPMMPYLAAGTALASVLKAFAERTHARLAWFLLVMNHTFTALAVAFNASLDVPSTLLYLGGIYLAALVGMLALERLRRLEGGIDLTRFHGHYYEHPRISFAVLLASLAISGFPITTAFLGEDLLFAHIGEDQLGLAVLFSLSFVIDGLAALRIFARIFFGPHVKTYHEVAYRSS